MATFVDRLRLMNTREASDAAKARITARRRVLPRPPAMVFPNSVEREYVRAILKIDNAMVEQVKKTLVPRLPGILEAVAMSRPNFDTRLDAYDYATEVANLMSLIRSNYSDLFTEVEIAELVRRIGVAVAAQNGRELGKVFRSVIGIDLFAAEPWLAAEMQAFVTANVSLIKTLPERFFPAIEQKVLQAAQQGISWKVLQKDLKKSYQTTNYQAERIARDQIGKFNGQINMLRQKQTGVRRYIWRTVKDARVRDEHAAREGQVFEWDKPPYDGNPGQAINCRCFGEPVLDDLLDF